MKQTLSTEVLESPVEKIGNVFVSPLLRVKGSDPGNPASHLQDAKSVSLKKGDSLNGIASRFIPQNKEEDVQKIRVADPGADDKDRIYLCPRRIFFGTGSDKQDLNSR
jgi:hypothetical protein